MNCAQAERKIYLYRELTPHEREDTDLHLATCVTCQAIMERIAEERAMLQAIRKLPPPLPDHSKITRGVMRQVLRTQQTKGQVSYSISLKMSGRPVRYAMAALSLLLLVIFAGEYSFGDGSQKITKRYPGMEQKHIELNSASFHKTLLAEQEKTASHTPSIYACLASCLHAAQADCADCNKFSKFN